MKTKILIIENSVYQGTTTRYVIEARLRVPVSTVQQQDDAAKAIAGFGRAVVIRRPGGSVGRLLELLQKRNVNRRNTEVCVLIMEDLPADAVQQLEKISASAPEDCETASMANAA